MADCHEHLDFEHLADLLYGDHKRILEQADILVVRMPVDTPWTANRVAALDLQPLRNRAPHASLHLLSTDNFAVDLSPNRNDDVADRLIESRVKDEFLHWLQERELLHYIKESNALFQARAKFVLSCAFKAVYQYVFAGW